MKKSEMEVIVKKLMACRRKFRLCDTTPSQWLERERVLQGMKEAVQLTIANYRDFGVDETKPKSWQVWMCDHAKGEDFMYREGDRAEVVKNFRYHADRGRDVWMISPDGEKILPSTQGTTK